MRKKLLILAILAIVVGIGVYLMQPEPFAPDNSSGDFGPKCKGGTPFHEVTIDQEGEYYADIDFDGIEEKICVGEYSNVEIFKNDGSGFKAKNVSKEIPYCLLRIHRCCPAHEAYTTINYLQKTIFTEAHYGCSDYETHQYKKIGDNWMEILPITPLSVLQRNLYPSQPRGWVYYWGHPVWKW